MDERSEMQLLTLARAQHGVVTTAQLAAAGLGRGAVAHRVAQGWLRRIHRGVYLVGPVELPLARTMAALLAVGPGAAICRRTAAALWAILPPAPPPIDVTVGRPGPRSRDGIRVHVRTDLARGDVAKRYSMPITSPGRTLVDLAGTLSDRALERAVEEAQVARLTTPAALRAAVERHRDRRGVARLRAVLDRHVAPALTRSEAERRLLELVRAAELPLPRANARLGRYEADLLWPEHRLVVEVDGYAFHATRAAFERDRVRDADLQAQGYAVMRITWRALHAAPHATVARIAAALATRAAL